ncbi:carboxylating nicotinate-nucleotide diphosphorylase [soil metagenome]
MSAAPAFGEPPGLVELVQAALAEDVGAGDVTTAATVAPERVGRARVVARAAGVVSGTAALVEAYRQVEAGVRVELARRDGAAVADGDLVAVAHGSFASLLLAERTALNFLQRLSGVASLAARFCEAVRGTGARIVDTRKTTPGWRALEKAAVRDGGGLNHRLGLYDAYLIKENHVAGAGGIDAALAAVFRQGRDLPVEIEVRSLEELDAVLAAEHRPDRILCDNFALEDLALAVRRVHSIAAAPLVEASGNVTLSTVRRIADTGVDWISVGALTHSAPALDLSCLIEPT